MGRFSRTDLIELYESIREALADGGFTESATRQIVLHPASEVRRNAASAVVMKGWACRRDLRDDIEQQAVCTVIRRLSRGKSRFVPAGPDAFARWLWHTWLRACRDAWASHPPLWLAAVALLDSERLDEIQDSPPTDPRRDEVALAIAQLDDGLQRAVLGDLLAGLNLRESAECQRMSISTIDRLRKTALVAVRDHIHRLQLADSE